MGDCVSSNSATTAEFDSTKKRPQPSVGGAVSNENHVDQTISQPESQKVHRGLDFGNDSKDGLINHLCLLPTVDLQRRYYICKGDREALELNENKFKAVLTMQSKEEQQEAISTLAQDNLRLSNQIHINHIRKLKISEILFSKNFNLNDLKCDADNFDEIKEVSLKCKEACQYDLNSFLFLSTYLQVCIRNFAKKSKSMLEVEEKLEEILGKLRKLHPPNENTPTGYQLDQIRSTKTKSLGEALIVDLSKGEENQRNKILTDFIIQICEKSKRNLDNLITTTKNPCLTNDGKLYKTGVKVNNPSNTRAMDRVKEKLLSSEFNKLEISKEDKDLKAFLEKEKESYHREMMGIFEKTDKPIEFTVSDMLRGKCMFKDVSQINQAARQIISKCKERNYTIVEIDNRLSSKTRDLVFKVLIDGIVTEFQLAYLFDVVNNEFNHKIYELLRSKFFTVISTLSEFNAKGERDLAEFYEILNFCAKMNDNIRDSSTGQTHTEPKKLTKEMKKWLEKCEVPTKEGADDSRVFFEKQQKCEQSKVRFHHLSALYSFEYRNYNLAEREIEKYGYLINKGGDDAQKLKYFKLKSSIAKQNKDFKEALEIFSEYLEIQQKVKGKQSLECASTLKSMGLVFKDQGYYARALELYNQCRGIQEKLKGKDSIESVTTLNDIGMVYYRMGEYADAIERYNECLAIQQKTKGKDSIEVAATLHNIGNIHLKKANYDKALELYSECLEIKKKAKGKDSIDCASSLYNIAAVHWKKRDFEKALKLYSECLEIEVKVKGKESIDYAKTLHNIAMVYKDKGDYDQALKLYEECLSIQQLIKGRDFIDCVSTLNNIGMVYFKKKDNNKASDYYKDALSIVETLPNYKELLLFRQITYNINCCHRV